MDARFRVNGTVFPRGMNAIKKACRKRIGRLANLQCWECGSASIHGQLLLVHHVLVRCVFRLDFFRKLLRRAGYDE